MSKRTDPIFVVKVGGKARPRTLTPYDDADMDMMKMVYKNKGKFHDISRPPYEERRKRR